MISLIAIPECCLGVLDKHSICIGAYDHCDAVKKDLRTNLYKRNSLEVER